MDSLKDVEDKADSGLLWFLWGLQSVHGAAAAGVPNLYMVEGVDSLKVWQIFHWHVCSRLDVWELGGLLFSRCFYFSPVISFYLWKGVTQSGFCNRLQITWIVQWVGWEDNLFEFWCRLIQVEKSVGLKPWLCLPPSEPTNFPVNW